MNKTVTGGNPAGDRLTCDNASNADSRFLSINSKFFVRPMSFPAAIRRSSIPEGESLRGHLKGLVILMEIVNIRSRF